MPRTWTAAQREEKAKAVKAYWQTHGHPNQGRSLPAETKAKMQKPKNRPPVKGHCALCGRPLYSAESVRRGLGPGCAGLDTVRSSRTS
jgi:hypothetical protein